MRMRSTLFRTAIAAAVTAGCSDNTGPGSGMPPQPGKAVIGAAGGQVVATLGDSGSITLVVPAGALTDTVTISLTPVTAGANQLFSVEAKPAGLEFALPVTLTITLPANEPAITDSTLIAFGPSTAPAFLPTVHDAAHCRLSTTTRWLGFVAPAAVRANVVRLPGAASGRIRVSHPSVRRGAGFSAIPTDSQVTQILGFTTTFAAVVAAAQAAVDRVRVDASPAAGDGALASMQSLLLVQPVTDEPAHTLALAWHDNVCNRFDLVIGVLRAPVYDDAEQLVGNVHLLADWQRIGAEMLPVAADGPCANDPDLHASVDAALDSETTEVLAGVQRRRAAFDSTSTVGVDSLIGIARGVVDLDAFFKAYGGLDATESRLESSGQAVVNQMRNGAYALCTSDGTGTIMQRLLVFEQTGGDALSTFSLIDLTRDAHLCTARFHWEIDDSIGATLAQGTLGGVSPVQFDTLASATIATTNGKLVLSQRLNAMRCPDGAPSAETIALRAENGVESMLSPNGAGAYLSPPVERTLAQLRAAASITLDGDVDMDVSLKRNGDGCGAQYLGLVSGNAVLAHVVVKFRGTSVPVITNVALRDGTTGVAYADTLKATAGTGTYAWQLVMGALPNGIMLNGANGVLSGTPTVAGDAPVTFRVTSGTQTADKAFTLHVASGCGRVVNGDVLVASALGLAAIADVGQINGALDLEGVVGSVDLPCLTVVTTLQIGSGFGAWAAPGTVSLSGLTSLQNLNIASATGLTAVNLPAGLPLQFVFINTPDLTTLSRLGDVNGPSNGFTIGGTKLTHVQVGHVTATSIEIGQMSALTAIDMNGATFSTTLDFSGNPSLTTVNLGTLSGQSLTIGEDPQLSDLSGISSSSVVQEFFFVLDNGFDETAALAFANRITVTGGVCQLKPPQVSCFKGYTGPPWH